MKKRRRIRHNTRRDTDMVDIDRRFVMRLRLIEIGAMPTHMLFGAMEGGRHNSWTIFRNMRKCYNR